MQQRETSVRRREVLVLGAACLFAPIVAPTVAPAQSQPERPAPQVIIVSRERLLREVDATRVLAEAERNMTALLQAKVDEANETFAAEEADLADLRATLPADQFAERIADFDTRVRRWRRTAQERAGDLQRAFQESRAQIVAALPGALERLRRNAGADVVVNAEQVLAADRALDYTARAVSLFNRMAPAPAIPNIDLDIPLIAPVQPNTADPQSTEQ